MNNAYTIEPIDHKNSSTNEGEVILTASRSCGCKAQYLMSSAETAEDMVKTYQSTECRECAGNTAYTKKSGGYLGKTK